MAAVTAARNTDLRNTSGMRLESYAVKTGTTVYQGTLVQLQAGRLASAASGTNRVCAGLALETKTGNTGGTVKCIVGWGMEAALTPLTALTVGFQGKNAFISTNHEVTTTGVGTALVRMRAGRITERVSATKVWVAILVHAPGDIVASA